jgi:hypothetical protein
MLADRLGIDYLLAMLRREGFSATMIHCPAQGLTVEQTVAAVVAQSPCLVGVSAASSHRDLETMGEIIGGVREGLPAAHLTLGGYAATFSPQAMLTALPEVDTVVRGEGEATFLELVGQVWRGGDGRTLPGVSARQNGQILHNPPRPLIQDLDTLPFPARDFLSLNAASLDSPVLISSSRGCYGTCAFCSVHRFYRQSPGRVWRGRSAVRTVDEMAMLKQQWGARRFQFVDDHFIGPGRKGRQRAMEFARELIGRKLRVEFFVEARADSIDEDLFRLLKQAGLTAVFLGIESGVQRTLDRYQKKTSVETNLRAIETLRRLGLGCAPGMITFEPFVTPAELRENVRFLRRSGLADQHDIFLFFGSHLSVYAGTVIETQLADQGLLREPAKKHARECVNIRDYDFVDVRSQALFDMMTVWRRALMQRYSLAGQSPGRSDRSGRLGTRASQPDPFPPGPARGESAETQKAWLQAQNRATLDLFEEAIDTLEQVPEADLTPCLETFKRRGLEALRANDVRFWGAAIEAARGPGQSSSPQIEAVRTQAG